MKWIASILLLSALASGQITVTGGIQVKGGVTVKGGNVAPPPASVAQLPLAWANPGTCNPPGGTYDVTKTIPGSYPATWAGINQAMTDWVAAPDQWWHVVVAHGTLITGNNKLNLVAKPVGSGRPTKCWVLESDTPLTSGKTVCSHGVQDNLASSTDPGIRNPDCNGTGLSYQLGSTVTSISPGAFTLANGTMTNTSAYNDVASMYTLETTSVNSNAVAAGAADVNGNGPNHILIRDAEIRLASSVACCAPVSMDNGSATIAGMPHDYGFDRVWLHGDATDAGAGTNSLPNVIVMNCGGNCWFTNSQISKSIRPGGEGHGIYWSGAQQIKIDHNWNEGQSINVFDGGITGTTPIGVSGVDIELRRNRNTYPWAWIGHGGAGGVCGVSNSCVRKNAFEMKGAQRLLMAGNIFENVDNSGGQNARIVGLNNRACTPSSCDNYVQTMANLTIESNIARHGCSGFGYDATSENANSGASASTPGRNILFSNNLVYDVSLAPALGCSNTGHTSQFGSGGHDFVVTSVTRNNLGTISIIVLQGGVGENQTGLVAGDPFTLSGCTDATFNVSYPFVYAATVSGVTITYPNPGTANASTSCTAFNNGNGWPNFVTLSHNTLVGDYGMSSPSGPSSRSRNATLTNNIFTGSNGWSTLGGADGTTFENANIDTATLIAHHNVHVDRIAPAWSAGGTVRLGDVIQITSPQHNYRAVTSGTSAGSQPGFSGTQRSCNTDNTATWQENGTRDVLVSGLPPYTEYSTIGVPTSPPVTLFFPRTAYTFGATADSLSVGFAGALNAPTTGTNTCTNGVSVDPSVNSALDLSDWRSYKLDTSSVFRNAGSDGTDLGMSVTQIESAQTLNQYVCGSPCGSGPYPDH